MQNSSALHKDTVSLVSRSSQPIRMRQIISNLIGDDPSASGWTDKVCDLADVLNDLNGAGVLTCRSDGWRARQPRQ